MGEPLFHILVVAKLHAGADYATNDAPRDPVRFERATFDEAMASAGPALAIDVPSGGGKPARVDLRFGAMRAFRPDALLEDVGALRDLRERAPRVAQPPSGSAGGSLVDDILAGMAGGAAPSGVSAALASVVHHAEVRALERAWRGLAFLASRADRDAVGVWAVHAEADEVADVLERVARRTDGPRFDLVVVDHALGASGRDLARLERWAELAEGLAAPAIANGSPDLVGVDDLAALGRSERRLRSSDDPRAAAVRAVAAREPSRWISLAMNGAVARPRHQGAVKRAPDVTLDEREDLFVGPAPMVAALCAASVARTGWASAITGPRDGVLRELPVHPASDRGSEVATPLEALASDEACAEAAMAGLALFASAPNTDVAILPHAPVLFRGAPKDGGASPPAALGLGDQLFVARLARLITEIAAAMPSDTPPDTARDVTLVALAELFGDAPKRPSLEIAIAGAGRMFLEVTVRPRGFLGVRLDEFTLGAPLAPS